MDTSCPTGYVWNATTCQCDLDSDEDGMPDWWETDHGLDPFDPADADQDWDGDWLTNAQEYAMGGTPDYFNVVPLGQQSAVRLSVFTHLE